LAAVPGTPQPRTAALGYTNDTIRKQFTGYERDTETDLDFAQARMHNFNLGRFSSPDPLMASAKRVFPQTWNRYTYVLNNPLNLIDPSGMIWGRRSDGNGGYEYRWFPGKKVGKGWDVCTGDCLIVENPRINGQPLGYAIRLNPNGFSWERIISIDVPGQRRSWLSHKDAEAINAATGGALCSLSAGFVCPNKGEKIADNVAAAADLVQIPFLVKSLLAAGPSIAAITLILKKEPEVIAKLVEDLTAEAVKLDRNGLTFAGRALQKHMSRPGSIYPQVPQTVESLNDTAASIVKQILDNPDTVYRTNRLGGIDAIVPDGFGIRYNKNGSFRGFLEP